MENTRRPFDNRSREPGFKKLRLTEDLAPNPNGKPFPKRTNPVGPASTLRFRASDSGTDELNRGCGGGGGAYEPQPLSQQQLQHQQQELVSQYKTALAELTFNSKPIITNLTIIAGENTHAAKAIAGTVCANIIEVPSDQKLPSLYLLDSIVKNIGRDYIKHFAPRLPEVFCKAYRQVDPPVRQSMRHLFGTWKGVFPLQCLQVIEKDLAFSSLANGSSSGTTTSRPDPLSQHQPHSIHVNPKYLEKQRLQQSSRAKGMVNDMTDSKDDFERPDRAAVATRRPSIEPSVKMNAPGMGVGRTSGKVTDPRIQAKKNVAGRSSIGLSSSWKNSEEEEFMWDMHSRISEHDAVNVSNNSRKDPWTTNVSEKSDFESQFRRAQSIHDVGPLDRENSDLLSTEQSDDASYGRRNSSVWSLQASHKTDGLPSISLSHSEGYSATIGGLPTGGSSSLARIGMRPKVGSSQLGTLGWSPKLAEQDYPQAHSSGKLNRGPLKHSPQASSASISSFQSSHHYPYSLPPQPESVQSEPSGQSQKQPLSQISKVGGASTKANASKHTNPLAIGTSELSSTSSLLAAVMKSGILSSNSFTGSLPNKISQDEEKMASFTGSLPNKISQDAGKMASLPSLPNGPPSDFATSGNRVLGSPPYDPIASTTNNSQGKVEQSPHSHGLPPSLVSDAPLQTSDAESKASIPVSNLLSSLVAKGLISAAKKDASSLPSLQIPSQMQQKSQGIEKKPTHSLNKNLDISTSSSLSASPVPSSSVVPRSSIMDEVSFAEPATKSSAASHKSTSMEVENLIGIEFKPDIIKEFHSSVIGELLDDLSHCCSLCGLRFKLQEHIDRHLEWHAMRKTESEGSDKALRGWYARSDDWIAGKPGQLVFESAGSVNHLKKTTDEPELMVPADENQCACMLCGELFEDYFSQDRGEWMFNGAVYLNIPSKDGEVGIEDESAENGPIVHANCMSERSAQDLGLAGAIKMEMEE